MNVSVRENGSEEIVDSLQQQGIYEYGLLYRVFSIREGVSQKVKDILRRGTDRLEDDILGDAEDGYFYLPKEYDGRLEERGRQLKPSEYLWLTEEQGLEEQLIIAPDYGELFVSVYDPSKMLLVDGGYCYEFCDKQRPKDALVALMHLQYQ